MGDMEIKIDKDVPLPSGSRNGSTGLLVRTLKEMAIGDSFLFELNGRSSISQRTSMHRRAVKAGVTVRIRNEGDGFRVWKISNERVKAWPAHHHAPRG